MQTVQKPHITEEQYHGRPLPFCAPIGRGGMQMSEIKLWSIRKHMFFNTLPANPVLRRATTIEKGFDDRRVNASGRDKHKISEKFCVYPPNRRPLQHFRSFQKSKICFCTVWMCNCAGQIYGNQMSPPRIVLDFQSASGAVNSYPQPFFSAQLHIAHC